MIEAPAPGLLNRYAPPSMETTGIPSTATSQLALGWPGLRWKVKTLVARYRYPI
jgi:hypothetical protein